MEHTYPIKVQKNEVNTIFLPQYNSEANLITNVAFGTLTIPCQVKTHPKQKAEILITEDLLKELKLPFPGSAYIFAHQDTVHIGPLIGVFTAGFIDSNLRPIGDRSLFFAKLLSNYEQIGTYAFVFGVHQINWDTGTINGLFYTKNGWSQHEVPFPDVVYDRLPNRQIENHDKFRKIKSQLIDEYLIPWFNPSFFDKWNIHQLLSQNEKSKIYLPETSVNPSFELIDQMLEKHQNIYLKPINGSLGHGVFQILFSIDEKNYYIRYQDKQSINRLRKFSSFEKVKSFLQSKIDFNHYIIQQGISLIRVDQKKIDFRIHTNKNRDGVWQITAMAGKIAGIGSVTTHIHNGGIVKTMEEIFHNPTERNANIKKLNHAALTISEIIDEKINGIIGEIGFDFGIDKNDNIWLFEANSRPGRSIFEHPRLKKYDVLSQKLSMEYALYLTKKTYHQPEEIYHQ